MRSEVMHVLSTNYAKDLYDTENAIVETVSHVLTVVAKKISLWFSCLWVDWESRISGVYRKLCKNDHPLLQVYVYSVLHIPKTSNFLHNEYTFLNLLYILKKGGEGEGKEEFTFFCTAGTAISFMNNWNIQWLYTLQGKKEGLLESFPECLIPRCLIPKCQELVCVLYE